jgi:antitoxin HicB
MQAETNSLAIRIYAYRALFEPGERRGVTVATFPDVPEAITEGRGEADARAMAVDALGLALLAYAQAGRALPVARRGRGELIAVAPDVAAKLAVLSAFAASGLTKREFARRLGKDEKEVRRILDPMHRTKLGPLAAALECLGRRLVVGVETIPDAA